MEPKEFATVERVSAVGIVSRWPLGGPFKLGRFVSTGDWTYVERRSLVRGIRDFATRYMVSQLICPPGAGMTTTLKEAAGSDPNESTVYINIARYMAGGSYSATDLARALDMMLEYADACVESRPHIILVDNCGRLDPATYAKLLELERGYAEQHSSRELSFLNSCQIPILDRPHGLLPPFTEDELATLLNRAHKRGIPEFGEAAQSELLALSGGWPNMVQMIAAEACRRSDSKQGCIEAAAVTGAAHALAEEDEQLHQLLTVARRHQDFLHDLPPQGRPLKDVISRSDVCHMLNSGVLVIKDYTVQRCHGLLDWMLRQDVVKRYLVATRDGEDEMSYEQITRLRGHPEAVTVFLDRPRRRAWVEGHEIKVTADDIRLLSCLLTNGSEGSIVGYQQLQAALGLGEQSVEPARSDPTAARPAGSYGVAQNATQRVHQRLYRLHQRIKDALGGRDLELVEACRGQGYRLAPDVTFRVVRRVW